MYLICDDYSDFKAVVDYKDLKRYLVDELKRDTLENVENENIVKNNFAVMEHLAITDCVKIDYLNEQLKSYGWYIYDLHELYLTINNLNEYCLRTDTETKENVKVLSDMLDFLHKEWNI